MVTTGGAGAVPVEQGGRAAVDAAGRHRALSSPSRTAILAVLRAEGAALAVERVADLVGLHVNTTREHLEVLVAAGLASRTAEARATRGRPRTLYTARGPAGPDGEPWLRDQLSRVHAAHHLGALVRQVEHGAAPQPDLAPADLGVEAQAGEVLAQR
uniref:helix-turn-helix domain-containing protein n=1 Tax=Cellulomonas hominis TaxID=156981 RepID=UPI0018ABC283